VGGTLTLIGTSTNILVDDLYRRAGGPGFGLFAVTPLGIPYWLVSIAYIVVLSQKLLPDRASLTSLGSNRHHQTRFITELIVNAESPLLRQSVSEVFDASTRFLLPRAAQGSHHRRIRRVQPADISAEMEQRIELLELIRDEHIYRGNESGDLLIQEDDVLFVSGTPAAIARFLQKSPTRLASALEDDVRRPLESVDQTLVEAVLLPGSVAVGRPLASLSLYGHYGVKVMGIQRRGGFLRSGLRGLRLAGGDVLLLQASSQGLQKASDDLQLLIIEGVERSIVRTAKNRIALLIMLAVVLLAAFTALPIVLLALVGAALMVITRCLRVDEAVKSLDAATLMLLAGTIPLGLALEKTGLAQMAVEQLVALIGDTNPIVFLSAFYLLASLLTEIISNNAVAVLLTPIALSLAQSLGINPTPLLMAVAFGASASFMTPMGYQTNAIVMGPGGYTYTDYLRVGLPLQLLMWLAATFLIPVFWPL